MEHSEFARDVRWYSGGKEGEQAIAELRSWSPVEIEAADQASFWAQWTMRAFGPIQLLSIQASAQRVVNRPSRRDFHFQLLHATSAPFAFRVNGDAFTLPEDHFVLLDLTQPFELVAASEHEATALFMPARWVERWLADPARIVAQPFVSTANWAVPLWSLIHSMAEDADGAVLPRESLAEQAGALFALAIGHQPGDAGPHKSRLHRRIARLIEAHHAEPEFGPSAAAEALGISKRYLHAVLAENGTTFMETLRRIRLDRAAALLTDGRFRAHPISDLSWRCGYQDPSHFARVFRQRFGTGPREWRALQLGAPVI